MKLTKIKLDNVYAGVEHSKLLMNATNVTSHVKNVQGQLKTIVKNVKMIQLYSIMLDQIPDIANVIQEAYLT